MESQLVKLDLQKAIKSDEEDFVIEDLEDMDGLGSSVSK